MKRALQSEPTLFTHVRVVTPERIRDGMAVLTKDGSIQGLYPEEETPAFEGRVIDGGGRYLAPGFIDIHCHGGGGHDFMDATPEAFIGACETHARYGTTTLLPTTLAGDDGDLKQTFEAYKANQKERREASFNYPLFLGAVYMAAALFIAYVFY